MYWFCLFYLAISIFYFKGEPGVPGAVGQNGMPGPKVSTNKTKQKHLIQEFSWNCSYYNFFKYPTDFTWVEFFSNSIICFSTELCDKWINYICVSCYHQKCRIWLSKTYILGYLNNMRKPIFQIWLLSLAT